MSNGVPLSQVVDVDAFARALYRRAKTAGADFEEVTAAVRRLHSVFKHLKSEADDPDSALNDSDKAGLYQRQLTPIIEDCEFTLKQLDTILEKHGDLASPLEARERDMLAVIASKLSKEKLNIDMFLDTVQLQYQAEEQAEAPPKDKHNVNHDEAQLDAIKDKVDAVAARVCQRRRQTDGDGDSDDETWQDFKAELENEGFSKDVLRQHKDVIRAYIRELDANGIEKGPLPSVRGLLEQERNHQRPDLAVIPASYPDREDWSPKEVIRPGRFENEKFSPEMKTERRMPDQQPPTPSMASQQSMELYHKPGSDDGDDAHDPNALALISTRELMVMDGLNAQMGAMQLHPNAHQNYSISPVASSTTRYLPPNVAATLPHAGNELALSSSPSNLSTSPRYAPLPIYSQAQISPPPPYGSSPRQQPPQGAQTAPSRYGMDIPLDAQWTKIKRSLVSPEVLERAGVRYEARPTFVAVLGILTRDDIAHYAHLSAVARARRASHANGNRPPPSSFERRYHPDMQRERSSSSRSPDDKNGYRNSYDHYDRKSSKDSDSESVLWDESDEDDNDDEKRDRRHSDEKRNSSFFIVPPPEKSGKDGTSPSSTVQPKPILKNKNENHVRFDPEPYEIAQEDLNKSPPRSQDRRRRRRDRDYHDSRESRDRERERERRRNHGEREYHSSSSRRHRDYHHDRDYHDRDHQDRDKDRERERERDPKESKRKWGHTLGAMGIGGAAGSLMSVLTDAASFA